MTAAVASDYTVTGFQSGVADAFLGDTAATAFSGSPVVTSAGAAATANIGVYAITFGQGTLAGLHGYTLNLTSPGTLTVNPKALTITANAALKTYGSVFSFAGTEFAANGLVNGDGVSSVSLTSAGAAATATVAGGPYAIDASQCSGHRARQLRDRYVPVC